MINGKVPKPLILLNFAAAHAPASIVSVQQVCHHPPSPVFLLLLFTFPQMDENSVWWINKSFRSRLLSIGRFGIISLGSFPGQPAITRNAILSSHWLTERLCALQRERDTHPYKQKQSSHPPMYLGRNGRTELVQISTSTTLATRRKKMSSSLVHNSQVGKKRNDATNVRGGGRRGKTNAGWLNWRKI